jgi:hypothetical protein
MRGGVMTTEVFGMSTAVHSHDWSTTTDAFGAPRAH